MQSWLPWQRHDLRLRGGAEVAAAPNAAPSRPPDCRSHIPLLHTPQMLALLLRRPLADRSSLLPAAARGFAARAGHAPGSGPPASAGGIPGVEHIVAVASGKGGVGKSTTAGGQRLACVHKWAVAAMGIAAVESRAPAVSPPPCPARSQPGGRAGAAAGPAGGPAGRGCLRPLHPPHDGPQGQAAGGRRCGGGHGRRAGALFGAATSAALLPPPPLAHSCRNMLHACTTCPRREDDPAGQPRGGLHVHGVPDGGRCGGGVAGPHGAPRRES